MICQPIDIRVAQWPEDAPALKQIRQQVFVIEQGVPCELEWDQQDECALHLLAETHTGEPIATARLLPSGQIGRMAVLSNWRGHQIGSRLLERLLLLGDAQSRNLFLNAQQHAVGFYQRLGFQPCGDPFDEAGIAHIRMQWQPK